MERIKKDLKEIIVKFVEDNDFHKPLMIIVRTNHGSSNPIVDDCRDWMVNNLKAFCFQGSPLHGHRYFVNNDKIERVAKEKGYTPEEVKKLKEMNTAYLSMAAEMIGNIDKL